jgi:hypothetical protein
MILDNKIYGILDHVNRTLVITEKIVKKESGYVKMLGELINFTSNN